MHNIKDIVLIPDWDTCTTEQPTSLKNGEKCLYFMYQLKLVLKNSNLNHNVLYMTYQNFLIVNCPELSAELLVTHTIIESSVQLKVWRAIAPGKFNYCFV